MVKRWLLSWLCVLFPLGALFAQPDDDLPTIYERINRHPEFTLFAQAIEHDGTWIDLLNDLDSDLTIFVPTDQTIRLMLAERGLSEKDFYQMPDLGDWLSQTVVPMAIDYDVLLDYPLTYVMTLLEERGLLIQYIHDRVYINTSRVDDRYYASNGIIYLLVDDALPVPPPLFEPSLALPIADQTVTAYLESSDDLTLFHALLTDEVRQRLSHHNGQLFTVFAPDDKALRAYLHEQGLTVRQFRNDHEAVEAFLERHIITGHITYSTLKSAVQMLDTIDFRLLTLGTNRLTFAIGERGLTVNDIPLSAGNHRMKDGVIHIINGVIE
jgi:uncharacterized surface protein with fasciclin (FAS1) repeats